MIDADLVLDRAFLTGMFADEDSYNTNSDGEVSEFPDGTPVVFCTNWAAYVRRVLGERAVIHGFFEDDNPSSKIAQACGGHDFAVVDGRWIVDGWVLNVEGLADRAVFDMDCDDDQETVVALFGDRALWCRSEAFMQSVDDETPAQRERAMRGTLFAERLSFHPPRAIPRP